MNINSIVKHIEWEEYYNPNFKWYISTFYKNNKLSEKFIREFKDKVCWFYISKYQKLNEYFIREFKDEVNWKCIFEYQNLSEKFKEEFKEYCK